MMQEYSVKAGLGSVVAGQRSVLEWPLSVPPRQTISYDGRLDRGRNRTSEKITQVFALEGQET